MSPDMPVSPRTFYLSEQHELARGEKEGGGGIPKYVDIDWAAKGTMITRSLTRARRQILESIDPSKDDHYFLLAAPVSKLTKASENKKKAVHGKVFEDTDFAEKHSRVFRRLGIDLLSVADDGSAVVHMKPQMLEQLSNTVRALRDLGDREKARWATIKEFETIPAQFRVDSEWLRALRPKKITDAVIEFQPLLMRTEIDSLIRAVVSMLLRNLGESVTGTGTDFSGRQWVRGSITPESLKKISESFFSVQSLHSPLISIAARSRSVRQEGRDSSPADMDTSNLPVVGVLDTGVPLNHAILSKYRRGTYTSPTSTTLPSDSHGCFVSSRLVFGDPDYSGGMPPSTPAGSARYYDMNIRGIGPDEIEDKSIFPAFQAIVSTAPDVRVFNMSFDAKEPLSLMGEVKRSEIYSLVQDLDNFIFQNDILVVVAAGNSPPGLVPPTPYPGHCDAPEWSLGPWARSFNSLTCGSFVGRLSSGGLVTKAKWPSPFCRVGPGLCESPKPDFSENGGNGTAEYRYAPGLGVWGLTSDGFWEDKPGSSFAAPLLARECAFALQRLQRVCERGAQPFSVTVKAFLCLTATPPADDLAVKDLSERTLGRGRAAAQRLDSPSAGTGVMVWQGVLEDEKDIARIEIPIPADWLKDADEPHLRLIVVWDPPVNAAVKHLWATRRITARLRMHPDAPAQHTLRPKAHASYPVLDRLYDLRKLPANLKVEGDSWLIEIAYEQIAEYLAAMTFPPQQRVSFAAELLDRGPRKISPQNNLQALTATKTMTRLTVPPTAARLPVVLRTSL